MPSLPWVCRACRSVSTTSLQRLAKISRRNASSRSSIFQVSEEVQQALSENRPVVALETTIYTHGFPYPQNMALATSLENIVRQNGGVPATIGILGGIARVGFTSQQLESLVSQPSSPDLLKISRRDIAFSLGLKDVNGKPFNGGTTISGTMVLAHLAGIKIFATGGLGGVHRGAENSMDISADLTELGRTPVAVISSGCKAFLDIPRTLEYLETQGVAVATFADGRTGPIEFPAFYTRDSGVKSPKVLRDEIDAARVVYAQNTLGLQSGMHFANPIPEKYSLPFTEMEKAILEAIAASEAAGATGAASTPYILDKIKKLTGSRSVEANTALVEANVIRGTKVAVELRKLEADGGEVKPRIEASSVIIGPAASNYTTQGVPISYAAAAAAAKSPAATSPPTVSLAQDPPPSIFIAGSLAVDLSCDYTPLNSISSKTPNLQTSNPARITQNLGGVGHNVALAAHLIGAPVRLLSAIGSDLTGSAALESLATSGMSVSGIATFPSESGTRTAQYVAINDTSKNLVLAMADMSILSPPASSSSSPILSQIFEDFWLPQLCDQKPAWVVVDGNWSPTYLAKWLQAAKEINATTIFEPVSMDKSTQLFSLPSSSTGKKKNEENGGLRVFPTPSVDISTPNTFELSAMHAAARSKGFFDRKDWWGVIDALGIPSTGARVAMASATSSSLVDQGVPQMAVQLLPFIPTLLVKLGAEGVILIQLLAVDDPRLEDGEAAPHILSRCNNGTERTLGVGGVYMRLFPAAEQVEEGEIVSVNGVGDTFAGTLVAGLAKGRQVEDIVGVAQRAAVLSLKSPEAVSGELRGLRNML